jgi:hypothetical protein
VAAHGTGSPSHSLAPLAAKYGGHVTAPVTQTPGTHAEMPRTAGADDTPLSPRGAAPLSPRKLSKELPRPVSFITKPPVSQPPHMPIRMEALGDRRKCELCIRLAEWPRSRADPSRVACR